jgi:hypothetical protein
MLLTEVLQKVQLVEGTFTPSQASDVISALIEEKINYHKIQRLSLTEGNEKSDCSYPNSRIIELKEEKQKAKDFLAEARREGFNVRINGTLEITFEK